MKLLILSDAPAPILQTGFSRVVTNLIRHWKNCSWCDLTVWGIGASATDLLMALEAGTLPCRVRPAGYPWYRRENLQAFLEELAGGGYTHVWILQDHFLLACHGFPEAFRETCTNRGIRSVYYVPVDAPLDPAWAPVFRAFDAVVPFTTYGHAQIRRIGQFEALRNPIPHGVDTAVYYPLPAEQRSACRDKWMPWTKGSTGPVLLNVNAHQQRKDLPTSMLVVHHLRKMGINARILFHSPSKSSSHLTDLNEVAAHCGLVRGIHWEASDQHFLPSSMQPKLSEADLREIYNGADLLLTTTLGEGWGLTNAEALACGLSVAGPEHTGLGDVFAFGQGIQDVNWVVPLETVHQPVYLPADNSRPRYPVDARAAACSIKSALMSPDSALSKGCREGLSATAKNLWDWERIAIVMMRVLEGK